MSPQLTSTIIVTGATPAVGPELVKKIVTSASSERVRRLKHQRKRVKNIVQAAHSTARRRGMYAVALTLTFSDDADFSPGCMRVFIDKARRWLKQRGHALLYVWVLERQERLHYHVILWLPRDLKIDLGILPKWWPWGSTWIERCKSVSDWGRYMAKLNSPKGSFSKNTRLYGNGGLDLDAKLKLVRASMPLWLQKILPKGESACRLRGGGWANLSTGEVYYSPYVWTPLGLLLLGAKSCGLV